MRSLMDLFNISPFVPLDGDVPNVVWLGNMYLCGCITFGHIPKDAGSNFNNKFKQYVFMSYKIKKFIINFVIWLTRKLSKTEMQYFLKIKTPAKTFVDGRESINISWKNVKEKLNLCGDFLFR